MEWPVSGSKLKFRAIRKRAAGSGLTRQQLVRGFSVSPVEARIKWSTNAIRFGLAHKEATGRGAPNEMAREYCGTSALPL